ncbi:MAG: type II toxin-antitoxin system VapB family antitoxin [Roseiarcus sp.]
MRPRFAPDDGLAAAARAVARPTGKAGLVHEALEALIGRQGARRLARLTPARQSPDARRCGARAAIGPSPPAAWRTCRRSAGRRESRRARRSRRHRRIRRPAGMSLSCARRSPRRRR